MILARRNVSLRARCQGSAPPAALVCSSLASLAPKTLAGNGPAAPSLPSAKLLAFLPSSASSGISRHPVRKPACNPFALLCRFFNRLQHGPSCRAAISAALRSCNRYSHVLNFASLRNDAKCRYALMTATCAASSASVSFFSTEKPSNKPSSYGRMSSWEQLFFPSQNSRDYSASLCFCRHREQMGAAESPHPYFPNLALRA